MGSAHGLMWATAAYAVILLCYGGGFGTMPSFNADYFGTRHMGANYGVLLTAWGAAGVAGPVFVAVVNDTSGAFSGALPVEKLISHKLPLVDIRTGFEMALHPDGQSLKIIIQPQRWL